MANSQCTLVKQTQNITQLMLGSGRSHLVALLGCAFFVAFLLLPRVTLADNPTRDYADSYSTGGQCYCDTTFDHDIGGVLVDTPIGQRTVRQVCTTIGPGPGSQGNPVYNDVQCGNGPPNNAGDEHTCPGRVDMGSQGCQIIGPTWNLNRFYPTSTPEPEPAPEPQPTPEPEPEPIAEPESTNLAPVLPQVPDQIILAGNSLSILIAPQDPEGFVPSLYLSQAPDGVFFNDNGDGSRTLVWLPTAFDAGQHDIIVVAKDALDDSLTSERLIRVDVVIPVPSTTDNLPPVINVLDAVTVDVGQQVEVLVNPTDPDGVVPGLYVENKPSNALFVDNLNGTRTLRWTPGSESIGIHEIRVVAQDGIDSTLTTSRTFTITVVGNTEQPVSGSIFFTGITAQSVASGATLEFIVQAIDPSGNVPWLHVENPPAGSSFRDNLNGTRTFSWTPELGDIGMREIRFIAVDSQQPEIAVQLLVAVTVVDPG